MSTLLEIPVDGQAPLAAVSVGDESIPRSRISKSSESRKLKKTSTLSEYIMHLTSLPSYDMMKTVPAAMAELAPEPPRALTRVLYDENGVTRSFLVNGVEALRRIPPFYYVNDGTEGVAHMDVADTNAPDAMDGIDSIFGPDYVDEDDIQHVESLGLLGDLGALTDSSSSGSSYCPSMTFSSSSSSSSSSDIHMSEGDADQGVSDTETARAVSPGLGEMFVELAADSVKQSQTTTEKSASTRHPSPLRASLSVDWLPDDRVTSQVVYEPPEAKSAIHMKSNRSKTRSPSPLPSLTPSPPPASGSVFKRQSPDNTRQRSPHKRTRRSPPTDDEYLGGLSGACSSDDDEYHPSSAPRSAPMASMSSVPHAGGSRQYHCIVKGCRSDPFSAPKDRNRHMDTHFEPRFRCPGCQRMFPRDDALRRHCRKNSSACYGRVKKGQSYEIHPPYWRSCSLDKLVRPHENDPLVSLFTSQPSA